MVAHIHPIHDRALVRPLIQVNGEGDGLFLPASHHKNAEAVRVKIMHVRNGRVPLIEGPLVVNECLGSSLIGSRRIL